MCWRQHVYHIADASKYFVRAVVCCMHVRACACSGICRCLQHPSIRPNTTAVPHLPRPHPPEKGERLPHAVPVAAHMWHPQIPLHAQFPHQLLHQTTLPILVPHNFFVLEGLVCPLYTCLHVFTVHMFILTCRWSLRTPSHPYSKSCRNPHSKKSDTSEGNTQTLGWLIVIVHTLDVYLM